MKRFISILTLALLSFVSTSLAGPSDGSVIGITKIVDKGPATDRYNLVLMGDGYTNAELPLFEQHAQEFVDFLYTTPPFNTSCSAINIYRIDVASDDSGADDPEPPADDPMTMVDESTYCSGGSGDTVATYFDSTFCSDGVIRRLLGSNNGTAIAVLNAQLPQWDQGLIIVNSGIYGGSGGSVGVTSVSGTWENIAIHEFGHSAFGLADEYEYWAGCNSGEAGQDNHPVGEPVQPNVTVETDPTLVKWKDLFFAGIDIPTTMNDDCSMCDDQANPFPGEQRVGLYEGAHYYHCDAYRPVFSCMMRNFAEFCPVCKAQIATTLAPYTPENTAPDCDAGGAYVAECAGATTIVALDGSASDDFDCNPLTFSWSGAFAESPASGQSPSATFSGTGVFNVDLTVDDGEDTDICSSTVTVQDTINPSITAPADVQEECGAPEGTVVALGTPTVGDICDAMPSVSNDAPALFPLGNTVVSWTATDASGNSASDTQTVEIVDTTPPTLTVSVSPTSLWPPNHTLHDISVSLTVEDTCDPNPTVQLISVTSNELANDTGDGNTEPDIVGAEVGTNDTAFQLRAERKGNNTGRVYTITYQAEDGSGNTTTESVEVSVAHNQ